MTHIVPQKTETEKRQSIWVGLPFMLVLFVFPIYATFAFQSRTGAEAGFLIGTVFSATMGLIAAGIVATFG